MDVLHILTIIKLFRQLRISVSLMTKINRKLKFHLKSRLSLLLNFQRVLRLQALRWTVDHFHIVNSNPLLFAQLQLLFIQFLWLIAGKCFREYIRIISFVFHLAAAPQPTCRTLQRLALCSVSVFWSLAAPLASNRPPVTNLKPQHEVRIHRINQKLGWGSIPSLTCRLQVVTVSSHRGVWPTAAPGGEEGYSEEARRLLPQAIPINNEWFSAKEQTTEIIYNIQFPQITILMIDFRKWSIEG